MRTIQIAGAAAGLLTFALFSLLWIQGVRRKSGGGKPTAGDWTNAAGFGFLPAAAVWKIFEPYAGPEPNGKILFDPLEPIHLLTRGDRFAPDRMELCAAVLILAAAIIWLILRREELPGNGDLLLTVICLWSAVRSTTETLRADTPRTAGASVVIIAAYILEMAILAVWTVRRSRKQKNAAMTALEWLAVIACGVIAVIQDAGVITMGSRIANLATAAGCSTVSAALILSAGKDSREA